MATRSNEEQNGGPGRTSNQGRKEASGGEKEAQQVGNPDGGSNRSGGTSRGGGSSRSKVTKGSSEGSGKKAPARRK